MLSPLISALEAVAVFVNRADIAKTTAEVVLPGVVAKALTARPANKKSATGTLNFFFLAYL